MRKTAIVYLLLSFLAANVLVSPVYSQDFRLPAPGVMVHLSPPLDPPVLKGIKVHSDNPFQFDFILDKGESLLGSDQLKKESTKLIKYFLAGLTVPEKDLWVNLSPYEKQRIIPPSFGLTEMGRDLLAEDYILKQITASLLYPQDRWGMMFWQRIYLEARKKYGTTDIPINTFNKVWIVPQKAVVVENSRTASAYVVKSTLKVMLEEDYLSLEKHAGLQRDLRIKNTSSLGSQIVREIVIPRLTKEVNTAGNFALLRQAYSSLILACWYKKKIKDSVLSLIYADKNKVAGVHYTSSITSHSTNDVEGLYREYLKAFKKGVFNFIKEEPDPATGQVLPRKYFSGGMRLEPDDAMVVTDDRSLLSGISGGSLQIITGTIVPFMPSDRAMQASKGALKEIYWTAAVPGAVPYIVGLQDISQEKSAAGVVHYRVLAARVDDYKNRGFIGSDEKGKMVAVLDDQYRLFNVLFNLNEKAYPWLKDFLAIKLSEQVQKPFDHTNPDLYANAQDALSNGSGDFDISENIELRQHVNQLLRDHGFEPIRILDQKDMMAQGPRTVNAAIRASAPNEDELALLKAASHFPNLNFFVTRDKPVREITAGRQRWVARPLFKFLKGRPVINRSPSPVPIDYYIDFGDRSFAIWSKTKIPGPQHPLEGRYVDHKDITMIELERKGIHVPRWHSIIVSRKPLLDRKRATSSHVTWLNGSDIDLAGQLKRELLEFLNSNHLEKGVIKPNESSQGEGVVFFDRSNIDAKIAQISSMARKDTDLLLQERIEPPFLYDAQGTKLDWNIRDFMPGPVGGHPAKVARIGPEGGAVNLSRGAQAWVLEKIAKNLGLSAEQAKQMEEANDQQAEKAFEAINKAMEEEGVKTGGESAADNMGIDIIVRLEGGQFVAYVIEINNARSGGAWDLDEALKEASPEFISPSEALRRQGEASLGWLERMYARGLANKDKAMNAPLPQGRKDQAMKGGIDLGTTPSTLTLDNNGEPIKFHMDPAKLAQWQNTTGFVPLILNIRPMTDISAFLGFN